MANLEARITSHELQRMAVNGNFRAEPILNSVACAQSGANLKVTGFTLIGPRRNRKVVELGADGCVDLSAVNLWLDSVAYATARIERRR